MRNSQSRTGQSRDQESHKEFELLYRSRDGLPSEEGYESVIFMKSKKCPDGPRSQSGKPSIKQLKKMIHFLQNKIHVHQAKTERKLNLLSGRTGLSNANNSTRSKIKKFQLKSKSQHKLDSLITTGFHLDASPPFATCTQFKTLQNTHQKINPKKKSVEKNFTQPIFKNQSPRRELETKQNNRMEKCDFLLLNNSFVTITDDYLNQLESKLKKIELQENERIPHIRQTMMQIQSEEDLQNHSAANISQLLSDKLSNKILQQIKVQNENQLKDCNQLNQAHFLDEVPSTKCDIGESKNQNLLPLKPGTNTKIEKENEEADSKKDVKQAIQQKEKKVEESTRKIQRWWKDVLRRKLLKDTKQSVLVQKPSLQNAVANQQQVSSEEQDDSDHLMPNPLQPNQQDSIEGLVAAFNLSSVKQTPDSLIFRQKAANLQLETQKSLIAKLLEDGKIGCQEYMKRLEQAEVSYHRQIKFISSIRQMLSENMKETKKLLLRIKEQAHIVKEMQSSESNLLEIMDKLFEPCEKSESKEDYIPEEIEEGNSRISEEASQQEARKDELKQIQGEIEREGQQIQMDPLVQTREKSKGCHFSSGISTKSYRKNREEFFSDSSSESEEKLSDSDPDDFYTSEFVNPASLKELLECTSSSLRIQRSTQNQNCYLNSDWPTARNHPKFQSQWLFNLNDRRPSFSAYLLQILLMQHSSHIDYYKHEFLRSINTPFGLAPAQRLKLLRKSQSYNFNIINYFHSQEAIKEKLNHSGQTQNYVPYVISQRALNDFFEHYYQTESETIISQKSHNRALFDGFNEALNNFRPYHAINGPPYAWNNSEKALTFYYIAEENIKQVFEKTQLIVLKWCSLLCGLMLDEYESTPLLTVQSIISDYGYNLHPMLGETREERQLKSQKITIEEETCRWELLDQQTTHLLLMIGIEIADELIKEAASTFILVSPN